MVLLDHDLVMVVIHFGVDFHLHLVVLDFGQDPGEVFDLHLEKDLEFLEQYLVVFQAQDESGKVGLWIFS